MHVHRDTFLAATLLTLLCGSHVMAQPAPPRGSGVAPEELVGRWARIAVITHGEDVTKAGVTQGRAAALYIFKSDGTFLITVGDSVTETGTWAANETAVPKTFDHTPNVRGQPGPFVPGIYEVGGGVLKICILPPSDARTRPTRCESKPTNGSRIYIMKRDGS